MTTSTLYVRFKALFVVLLCIGFALTFSLSHAMSFLQGSDSFNFLLLYKQLIAGGIGYVMLMCILRMREKTLRSVAFLVFVCTMLIMCYGSLFGVSINGARRWIYIFGVSLQIGEFARVSLLLYIAHIMAQYDEIHARAEYKLPQHLLMGKLLMRLFLSLFLFVFFLYLQRDFSTLLITVIILSALASASSIPKRKLVLWFALLLVIFFVAILLDQNRLERIANFFSQENYSTQYQLSQAFEKIAEGGFLGKGIGNGMVSITSLPYFNHDFVFAYIVHEYGLVGAVLLLSVFVVLARFCLVLTKFFYKINRFYCYVVIGSALNFLVPVSIHIMVNTGLWPTAGLVFPFLSTGGNSLIASMLSFAFLLKAAKERQTIMAKAFEVGDFDGIN